MVKMTVHFLNAVGISVKRTIRQFEEQIPSIFLFPPRGFYKINSAESKQTETFPEEFSRNVEQVCKSLNWWQ